MPTHQSKLKHVFSRTTSPVYSTPVVPLARLKEAARLPDDLTEDDFLLTNWCATAERLVESHAEIALREQIWTLRLPTLPRDNQLGSYEKNSIRLEIDPVTSVVVKYYDEDDVLVTVDPSDVELEQYHVPALVILPSTLSSELSPTKTLPLIIEATCGVAGTGDPVDTWDIPPEAITAISQLVAHWYKFREAVGLAPFPEHGEVYRIYSDLIDLLRWRML